MNKGMARKNSVITKIRKFQTQGVKSSTEHVRTNSSWGLNIPLLLVQISLRDKDFLSLKPLSQNCENDY